jgi:hypothetical protein
MNGIRQLIVMAAQLERQLRLEGDKRKRSGGRGPAPAQLPSVRPCGQLAAIATPTLDLDPVLDANPHPRALAHTL